MRISIHDAPPFDVPTDQVVALCAQISHLDRLCQRTRLAAETGGTLHLTDAEALLLITEIQRQHPSHQHPLQQLANALLNHTQPLPADTNPADPNR
jgi:hypothetical protein